MALYDRKSLERGPFVPLLLFVAAVVAMLPQLPTGRLGTGFESISIARNLAEHGEFANPYLPFLTGLSAHLAPLYPGFLGLLIYLFGYSAAFVVAIALVCLMVQGLHAALLPYVSDVFFGTCWPGIIGAALGIVLPLFSYLPHSENVPSAVGLMLFVLAAHRLASRTAVWPPILCGLFLGVLALLNPGAAVTAGGPYLAYLLWRKRDLASVRFALLAGLGFVVALTPWTWRNYRVFHSFVFVRDNLGMELWFSNNDLAGPSFTWNQSRGVLQALHPGYSVEQTEAFGAMGEVAYNRDRMAEARQWIRSHPARFRQLTADRIRLFWFPDPEAGTLLHCYSVWFLTLSTFFALALLARRRQQIAVWFIAVLLLYPVIYYLTHADARYRVAILWIFLLGAGYLLFAGYKRIRPESARIEVTHSHGGTA